MLPVLAQGAVGATGARGVGYIVNVLTEKTVNLNSVASPTDENAQNSGIVVKATNDKTLLYYDVSENYTITSTDQFDVENATQQAKLTASDANSYDLFGNSVGIHGDYCIVGAYGNDDSSKTSGSAYIFTRSGTTWSQQTKLLANDAAQSDWFGYSVGIHGDYCIVGAYGDDDGGTNSGGAYIFVRNGTSWSQQAKLTASDAAAYDYFGWSVGIHGDYCIVAAYSNDDNAGNSGSCVYFYLEAEHLGRNKQN